MTLLLEIQHGASRQAALSIAVGELAALNRLTRGSAKKNRSEARAILEFGWRDVRFLAGDRGPADLLNELASRVSAIQLDDVRRQRATALDGAKGGRPTTGEMRILALVLRLRDQAATHPGSARECEAMRAELAAWAPTGSS